MSSKNPQKVIQQVLQGLNFSDKEILIYLDLQKISQATPTQLARRTGVNRTSVYDIIQILLQRGVISQFKKRGRLFFVALDPNHLITYLHSESQKQQQQLADQIKQVEAVLPNLLSLHLAQTTKPTVTFFEGESGMREAYEETLKSKGLILAYANVQTMHEGLPSFFPEYYQRRVAKKIFIRAILPQNELSLERAAHDQLELRETRLLPTGQTFTPEINLFDDKMLIASWTEKMAIIITSKELVDLQKLLFDLTWNQLSRHHV